MRAHAVVLGLAMLGLLAGCGQPTPYQPAVDGYGYSEQQIEDNRYRVSFAGNDLTPARTVQNNSLYRAAELTLDRGYDYFTVVDRSLDRSTAYRGTGDTHLGSGYFTRRGDFVGGLGFTTYSARPIDSYTAYADVVMFEGEKPPATSTRMTHAACSVGWIRPSRRRPAWRAAPSISRMRSNNNRSNSD